MIKLVVFDWNATLLADTAACMAADNHVLKTFGGKPVGLKVYRNTIIIPAVNFYSMHGCNKKYLLSHSKRLGHVFHSFYEPRAAKVRSRKWAKEVLKWLIDHNIETIILSNHTLEGIEFQLKRLGLKPYISKTLANTALDSSMKNRDKVQRLVNYLRTKHLKKSEIMIIGDSPEEPEIGKKLGLVTTAITEGYYATWRLKACKPDFLIHNLKDLIPIIKKLNSQ